MGNFCKDCKEILVEDIEFRYGYCAECLAIRMEKLDDYLLDLWYSEGGS